MFYEAGGGKVKVGWGEFGRRGFQNSSLMLLVDSSKRRFFQMVDVMVPGVNRLLVLKENLRVQIVPSSCSVS